MQTSMKLASARLWACRKVPYFTTPLLSLVYREVPLGTLPSGGTGTMAMTDRGVLVYEAAAVDRWKVEECGSVIVHEMMHFLRKHSARLMGRDPRLWNLANDAEINDDLHAMKLPLPDGGGITPATLGCKDGRMAEEYYAEIIKKAPPPPPSGGGGQGPQPATGGAGHGQCGSCAGHPVPGEEKAAGGPKAGRAEAEQQVIRLQTAHAIQEHVKQHGIGSVPAGLHRWAEDMVKPSKISWREKLAHSLRGKISYARGLIESTYQKISRRQAGLGFGVGRPIMAAAVGRHPRVFVAIDTSGSMGEGEIERGVAETVAIVEAVGGEITLLSCDCHVHTTKAVMSLEDIKGALKGGGGTDFHPVFKAIEEMDTTPDVLVFVTDGGGYAPIEAPDGYEVIWLLVGSHRCTPLLRSGGSIEWGEHIEIDEDMQEAA